MTNEIIEDFRNIIKPFVSSQLLKINNDGLGIQDKEEFEKDFDEILDLAIEALYHERPHGKCKNCKEYRCFDSWSDGYCNIVRMTAKGETNLLVNENFYCSYFKEGGRQ